jgi:hypothetical protein
MTGASQRQQLRYARERLDPVELSWEGLGGSRTLVALQHSLRDPLAEVTWTAPTPDDPTVTGYEVTPSPADTPAVVVDHTARTATVSG